MFSKYFEDRLFEYFRYIPVELVVLGEHLDFCRVLIGRVPPFQELLIVRNT